MKNNEKQLTKEIDVSVYDMYNEEIYALFLNSLLEKSREDIKNGKVITLEEFEKEMELLYESYDV